MVSAQSDFAKMSRDALPGVDLEELSAVISQQPGGVENLAELMADMEPELLEMLGKKSVTSVQQKLLPVIAS